MPNSRLRFLMPRRAPIPSQQSTDLSVAPELSMDPRAREEPALAVPSLVDSAVYRDGRRAESPATLEEALRSLPDEASMAWIGLYRPSESAATRRRRGVRAARAGGRGRHRRPPAAQAGALRRDAVRRAARGPLPRRGRRRSSSARSTSSSDLDFVLTVRHSRVAEPGRGASAGWRATPSCCGWVRRRCCTPSSTRWSTATPRWCAGLQNDIDEIETEVFGGDPTVSRRIYELSPRGDRVPAATRPLLGMLAGLRGRVREVRHRRGAATLPARRRTTTPPPWSSGWTASARSC